MRKKTLVFGEEMRRVSVCVCERERERVCMCEGGRRPRESAIEMRTRILILFTHMRGVCVGE